MEELCEALERIRRRHGLRITPRQSETRNIRGTYNLTPESLELNRALILQVEAEQEKCRGCEGTCRKKSAQGMIPVLNIVGDDAFEVMRMCKHERQRREQAKLNRLFRSACVPRVYAADTFTDYKVTPENEDAVKAAKWIIKDDSGRGLFIYGPRGTGKTKLTAIIANERVKEGKPVLFSSVPDLMGDIRASFHRGNTEETLQSVKEAAFLVLDDLGAERMTEWVGEQLFAIINHRYNERLTTVITSNYSPDDIIERMAIVDREGNVVDDMQGNRIMSRIFGMCEVIRLGGEDYRTRGVTA